MTKTKNGPDAPTRLAKAVTALSTGDYLQAPVYYIPESDVFLTVDNQNSPTPNSTVAVEELADGALVIEPYCGQRFIAVMRILQRFNIALLDWWLASLLIGLM